MTFEKADLNGDGVIERNELPVLQGIYQQTTQSRWSAGQAAAYSASKPAARVALGLSLPAPLGYRGRLGQGSAMSQASANVNVMIKAARKAARSLLRDFGEVEQLQVSSKGPGDFVSKADIRAEQLIREELTEARPNYGWLGEESGEVKGADPTRRWIVDPLDGTTNFLHGLPHWSISIALEHKGEVVAGVIYDPVKDEMFVAEKGGGAYLNDRRLRVSGRKDLIEMIFATGIPFAAAPVAGPTLREIAAVASGHGRRAALRLGGARPRLCRGGAVDGYWERGLKPWDLAAGLLPRARGRRLHRAAGRGRDMLRRRRRRRRQRPRVRAPHEAASRSVIRAAPARSSPVGAVEAQIGEAPPVLPRCRARRRACRRRRSRRRPAARRPRPSTAHEALAQLGLVLHPRRDLLADVAALAEVDAVQALEAHLEDVAVVGDQLDPGLGHAELDAQRGQAAPGRGAQAGDEGRRVGREARQPRPGARGSAKRAWRRPGRGRERPRARPARS